MSQISGNPIRGGVINNFSDICHILERGGGGPLRGMSSKRVGRGALGRDVLRASVRPFVTLKKGPKGLQNDQETCTAVVKREKVKSYQVLKIGRLAKCPLEFGFGTRFGKIFFKKRVSSRRLFSDSK